jgi:hypothetical protein
MLVFVPRARAMTLRSYLIPQAFPEARIPPIRTVEDVTVPSTATHRFSPPLHLPDRIPVQISLDFELPCKIHRLLLELLSDDKYRQVTEAPASNRLVRNYGVLQDFCEGHRFHVSGHQHDKEPSVTELAVHLADPVRAAYRDLTGEAAVSDSQVRTNDGAVKSDRTYSVNEKVAILWEDKALLVFRKHMGDLLNRLQHGDSYFRNVGQQSWEGVEAILAKVRLVQKSSDVGINMRFGKIAYHALDQDEADRPSWSIIFGGDSYMILFLAYTADANDKQRIAIFCSGILSIYHEDDNPDVAATRKLPVCSAIVYMLLSTHDAAEKTTLQKKLGVRVQHPPPLPDGFGRRDDGSKYSRRLQLVRFSPVAFSEVTECCVSKNHWLECKVLVPLFKYSPSSGPMCAGIMTLIFRIFFSIGYGGPAVRQLSTSRATPDSW